MKLKNEALQKLYDTIVSYSGAISPYADSPIYKAFEECDNRLQDHCDILEKCHESDVRVIGKLHCQMANLEDEKTEQEKRADILKAQRDEEVDEKFQLQREVEQLKKQLDGALEAKKAVNNSRYKWAQKWLSTKQNLEAELNKAEVKYRRLEKEHEELTSEYQELSIENKRLQDGLRGIGYEQGQTDLWVKLQDVKDMQPNEFDTECECLGDVIDMDLEDFLDTYKKWWEQKEADRMREWLVDFCWGRVCEGCPLACEGFCEAVKDANIKITENLRNGYTLKATADVDKDLLDKVCGIVPVEEDHKLEYGDAVRLPWRDYDYMYIDADKNHIRLFNPKTHTVVLVSPSEKLTYQGCKIVLTDEDDLRKIWKDKK